MHSPYVSGRVNLPGCDPPVHLPGKIALFAPKYKVNATLSQKVLPIVLLSLLAFPSYGQDIRDRWVDSVFRKLDRKDKVAQLFMVPADPSATSYDNARDLVKDGAGGIWVTQGGPESHARLVNNLQAQSRRPLLVGMSAEWGAAQSLDSVSSLPKPFVMGALSSDSLVTLWAQATARQLKDLGVHVNFAPNADNEIFSGDYLRYFSSDLSVVGRRAASYVRAMQAEGVLTVAKHLPRRWSTERALPDSMIVLNLARIDTASLRPYQQLIREGIAGIATDYMHFSIQNEQGIVPASVSQAFVTDVLRNMMQFRGLVFSDARVIRQRLGKVRAGEAELLAFQTGADMIVPLNGSAGISKITRSVRKNKLLAQQLDESVKRILRAKFDAGLNQYTPINSDNLRRRLQDPDYDRVTDVISTAAVTVVQNTDSLLPIRHLDNASFVTVIIGTGADEFDVAVQKYVPASSFRIRQPLDTAEVSIKENDIVLVAISPFAGALEKDLSNWLVRLGRTHNGVLTHFWNPASLANYRSFRGLVAAYTDQDRMPAAAAQVIFGGHRGQGILPVDLGDWKSGQGLSTIALSRLSYGVPESAGVSSRVLTRIRPIMEEAIASGATPGCHTLVVKDGKVIYSESAGHLTWEKKQPVTDETIYDLASVTKISATLQTVLFMHDHGLIDINKKASVYLPELKASNKADFTLKDILTHQAGLWPFLPFWAQTIKDNTWMPEYYSTASGENYPFPVAENLFASRAMKDSLWQWIIRSRIRDKAPRTPYDYRYSDMGFYILQHLAEKLLNQPMEDFLAQNLYDPLGAYTTGYLPLNRFPRERIAPTEQDTLFRKSLLIGYVHDQGAAMHGGIAGHAGLFSTANDLAKVGQMWLQRGSYGGLRYFKPETIDLFTTKQYADSRRGLGWDKPVQSDWTSPTAPYTSARTFGHTGFTGTCIWVDPEFNLVYIFLSNRVMPDMNNNRLLNANIRPRIQQVIYEAIFDYCAAGK